MIVNSFICTYCADQLYGRTIDDEVDCSCGKTTLKGDYKNPKIFVNNSELIEPELIHLELKGIDKDNLFWDQNLFTDNYGLITTKKTYEHHFEYSH